MEKGVIEENETLFYDDIEPEDSRRISDLNLTSDSVIEIKRRSNLLRT
jgi:hypothetical protein